MCASINHCFTCSAVLSEVANQSCCCARSVILSPAFPTQRMTPRQPSMVPSVRRCTITNQCNHVRVLAKTWWHKGVVDARPLPIGSLHSPDHPNFVHLISLTQNRLHLSQLAQAAVVAIILISTTAQSRLAAIMSLPLQNPSGHMPPQLQCCTLSCRALLWQHRRATSYPELMHVRALQSRSSLAPSIAGICIASSFSN